MNTRRSHGTADPVSRLNPADCRVKDRGSRLGARSADSSVIPMVWAVVGPLGLGDVWGGSSPVQRRPWAALALALTLAP